ncbi:MAG: HD-GYP domain-containing protein [Syntrophales bacterium]
MNRINLRDGCRQDELAYLRSRVAKLERMLSCRQKSKKILDRREKLMARVMETSPAGIIVVNRGGLITFANARAEQILGLKRTEITQRPYDAPEWRITDYHGGRIPKEDLPLRRVLNTRKPVYGVRYAIEWPGGSRVLLSINAAPLFDPSGAFEEIVFTLEDITKQVRSEEALQESYGQLRKTMEGTIQAMEMTIEMRDPYTAGHQQRVANLACAIADNMRLPREQIEGLYMAAVIHDIGKIYVPAEILSKPCKLNEFEYVIVKTHPQVGYNILRTVDFPWPIAQMVFQHHERMDGSGYPAGISGKNILLEARILAVADIVESMASHRPYRPAFGIDKASEEIVKNRGSLYDPDVVDSCRELIMEKGFRFE